MAIYVVVGERKELYVAPAHVAHSLGGGMRTDANPRSDVKRGSQNCGRQNLAQELVVECEIPKERKVTVAGIVSLVTMPFDPMRQVLKAVLDGGGIDLGNRTHFGVILWFGHFPTE